MIRLPYRQVLAKTMEYRLEQPKMRFLNFYDQGNTSSVNMITFKIRPTRYNANLFLHLSKIAYIKIL